MIDKKDKVEDHSSIKPKTLQDIEPVILEKNDILDLNNMWASSFNSFTPEKENGIVEVDASQIRISVTSPARSDV